MPLIWKKETLGQFKRTDPQLAPIGGYSGDVRLFLIYPQKYKTGVGPGHRTNEFPVEEYTLSSFMISRGASRFTNGQTEAELRQRAEELFQDWLRRAHLQEAP